MQRLLIVTFLVLFSSCGKDDDVFVFEGTASNSQGINECKRILSADYSVQLRITDANVYFQVKLTNAKQIPPNAELNKQFGRITFSASSTCYDELGNYLFDFEKSLPMPTSGFLIIKQNAKKGIWTGQLPYVSRGTARKVDKVKVQLFTRQLSASSGSMK